MGLQNILETIVVVASVIGLVWAGIQIGREFGTFEKFAIALLYKAEKALNGDQEN